MYLVYCTMYHVKEKYSIVLCQDQEYQQEQPEPGVEESYSQEAEAVDQVAFFSCQRFSLFLCDKLHLFNGNCNTTEH